ncbi:MAG: hypothetical protein ACFB9N_03390 [Geitlerinemataceae cyanobacterium]
MTSDRDLEQLAKQELEANGFESCVRFLRDRGVGKYRTGTIMASVLEEHTQAVRAMVHWSKTWEDVRYYDALFEDGKYSRLPKNNEDEVD